VAGAALVAGGDVMLGFIAWRAAELWPVALAALVLLAAGTVLLYPSQVSSLGKGWRRVLPALRFAAIAALAASVLRPVVIRARSAEEEGAVVILFDRSLSMGARDHALIAGSGDHARAVGELISLADGLGRLSASNYPAEAAGLLKEIRKLESLAEEIVRVRREADYARLSGREPREAQNRLEQAMAELIRAAGSAGQRAKLLGPRPALLEDLAKLARAPRLEDREGWIRGLGAAVAKVAGDARDAQEALDEELYQSDEQVRAICNGLSRMSRLDLCWDAVAGTNGGLLSRLGRQVSVRGFAIGDGLTPVTLRTDGEPVREFPIEPGDATSDLSGGIRRALQQLGGQPVQAVVLFSDGRQVGASAGQLGGLVESGIPIFTVYAGSPRTRDMAVAGVELPVSVFVDEEMKPRVHVRTLGMDLTRLTGEATLSADGVPISSRPLVVKEGAIEPLEFWARLPQAGVAKLQITLPTQEGEASAGNNSVERWVKVLSQKLRVTAVSGSAGWDFRYLRNVLGRTPWVDLREAVIVSGLSTLAMSPEDILQQDLVILNDVSRDTLTAEQWDAVRELVYERGGSVVLIAGIGQAQSYAGHLLADLLPYPSTARPAWRSWPGQTPRYHMAPTAEAENLESLRLENDAESSRRRWEELPGFYRYLSIPELKLGARVLLVERESGSPLLTESRLGAGRVLFLGMSETWRWRGKVSGRDQDRFWVQLVRYAADEPYALSSGVLSFDADRVTAEPDETVHVRARVMTGAGGASARRRLEMSVMQAGELMRTLPLEAVGSPSEGHYAGTLSGLPEGEYELRATLFSSEGPTTELALPLKIERNAEAEMGDLSGDPAFLQQLAESSGGKALSLDQVGSLPMLLEQSRQRQPRFSELHLWDSAYLFVFVLSCLTAEWSLRKRFGLA
jgi:hypothetical protein